ncbi:MAG: adenylyltransferase/cytidyltransferase family protein [Candidatus Omnitrophota bacterium]
MKDKKIIGYAYVVADLLHKGHRLHLKNCKALCDYLIVGILSEKAVLEKKPAPIQSLADRIEAVQDLKYVDCAVCQDQYSPLENCKAIRPDILFESSSHVEMPANNYIKSIGNQIFVMPYYSEESSSRLKKIINERKEIKNEKCNVIVSHSIQP